MEKKERYFYVTYSHPNGVGGLWSKVFSYINHKESIDYIKKENSVDQAVITNIIEMTKEDYEEFIK